MRITLKEILDEFKDFVNNHYELLTYGFGDLSNISTKNTDYPLLWIVPGISRINGSEMILGLDMYMLDLEKQDLSNLEDIMSKTLSIGNDIVAKFWENGFANEEYDVWNLIEDNVSIEAVEFKHDDVLAGWIFNMQISIENPMNECVIPIKED